MLSRVTFCSALIALSLTFIACEQKNTTTTVSQEKETPATSPAAAPAAPAEDEGVTILQQPEADTLKGSLKAVTTGKIGPVNLKIAYHSPAVRERVVWGGLVPYDRVWVTGAHSATSLETDSTIHIGGVEIPAGKYALFTMPGRKEWTVIINKDWEMHLADKYSATEDVVRISVKPIKTEQHQERLRYEIKSESDEKGSIVISWEKMQIPVPVTL